MKPYESYKKTDILWLEEIPGHWDMTRGKNLYYKENRAALDTDDVVTCFRDGQVTLRKNRRTSGFTESIKEIGYQHIEKGDLIVHVMDAFAGAVGVSDSSGKGTPVYSVCKAKITINNFYYAHIIRQMALSGFIQSLYRGIRERSSDFRFEVFAIQMLPVPPRAEQDQIVRFLDWKLSKINKLIKAKKKQIELLNEQKQAIINKAVTKGLDDNVSMKDSNIFWLDSIPIQWKSDRLKRFCKVNASISHLKPNYNDEDMVVFLPMEKVSSQGETDCTILRKFKDVKNGYSSFAKNDVVVAKITPCFENGKGACLNDLVTEIGYGTTEFITLRTYQNMLPKYLYYITRLSWFRLFGADTMTGSAGQKRITNDFISNFTIGVPNIIEQQDILNYIETTVNKINNVIAKVKCEIDYISEYKISLISSVVTGQVDVRDVVIPNFEHEEDILEEEPDIENEETETMEEE